MSSDTLTLEGFQDKTGEMGWGRENRTLQQNHVVEAKSVDQFHRETGMVCGAAEAKGAAEIPEEIEKTIRARFHFDEGWSFLVAEQILLGLEEDETWMATQLIGNCVGDSHAGLLSLRIAHEVFALGQAEEALGQGMLGAPFIPYSYGVGRMVGNMLGPGDGSYCGAQMEGTLKYGFLPCFIQGLEEYAGSGDAALPQGTASANRLFGRSRDEIEKWTDKAIKFKMLEAPKCRTAEEAKDLIVIKKTPLQICSGWGFAYWKFDEKYGVHLYRASGSWSHSMQVVAIFAIKGQWFVVIRNQWGKDAHKGSPEIKIPGGCFVITLEDFARWIRDAEVMGIGEIDGLPSKLEF